MDFKQRVIEEKQELDAKIKKLREFIAGEVFESLPRVEAHRLARQCAVMIDYSAILGERIADF